MLTEAQKKRMSEVVDLWIEYGTRTWNPEEREMKMRECIKGAKMAYAYMEIPWPGDENCFMVRSTCEAVHFICKLEREDSARKLGKSPSTEPYTTLEKEMAFNSLGWAQHDAGWLAFYDFALNDLGMEQCRPLEGLLHLSKHCAWWAPFKECCVFVQHPIKFCYAEEDGHDAVMYEGGWNAYEAVGLRLPRQLIEAPETITIEDVLAQENAELRRRFREAYGTGRYLRDTGAKVVHVDSSPTDCVDGSGSITRALMEDLDGDMYLVGSDGSTDRVYFMRGPSDATTCRDVHEAISGLSESDMIAQG